MRGNASFVLNLFNIFLVKGDFVSVYAGIVIDSDSIQLDRIFTYKIPEKFQGIIELGFRVKVPFGLGNKLIDGFVLELSDHYDNINKLKYINDICDEFPVLTLRDIELINTMKNEYLCSYIECIRLFLPKGIMKGVSEKKVTTVFAGNEPTGKFCKENYTLIYNKVLQNNGVFGKNELSKKYNFSLSSINTMIKYGFLITDNIKVSRYNTKEYDKYAVRKLNAEQSDAVETILYSDKNKFLIHGVTGSGKTEIYMALVRKMMELNKDSIILVPEIALTPQMVERFKGRFGKDIAVFHSRLSDGERYDEWFRVKKGEVKVAIGARSAVFLPFNNLGIIVIDEEHEGSYKSESDPKYNAREIAEMICGFNKKCKIILGSATPSVETYHKASCGEYKLIEINNRADGALMPKVTVVDMREELINNNRSIFSNQLFAAINDRLEKKEQSIIFLNRRGFSTFVSCRKCGYVFKCTNCDISLTYHNEEKMLVCHYCGKRMHLPDVCPKCKSRYVKYFGIGTEKIEQEIRKCFPSSRTLRMDFDTTRKKNSYEKIYEAFKNKEADILIGTQMVAKGLDFPDVTLVGIVAADLSLNMPDFRSGERTFQLITQVSGRAGRGKKQGEVIVQTYNPENSNIMFSVKNDYINFYNEEIRIRECMNYPPFTKILHIVLSSKNENLLIKTSMNLGVLIKKYTDDEVNMLGPCPCEISKIKEMFRWQIILKGNFDTNFSQSIKNIVYDCVKDVYNEIRISLDINPNSLL